MSGHYNTLRPGFTKILYSGNYFKYLKSLLIISMPALICTAIKLRTSLFNKNAHGAINCYYRNYQAKSSNDKSTSSNVIRPNCCKFI